MLASRAVASDVAYTLHKDLGIALTPIKLLAKTLGNTFSPLTSNSPCFEATQRVSIVILSPVFFLAGATYAFPLLLISLVAIRCFQLLRFTVRFCLNKQFQQNWYLSIERLTNDSQLGKQIKLLKRDKPAGWEDKAISLIRKSRYASNEHELQRLRTIGILTPKREAAIDRSTENLSLLATTTSAQSKKAQFKVLKAQALEISDILGQSYDILLSAQATRWAVISHLVTECIRTFEPERKIKHFKFLRSPSEKVELGLVADVLSWIQSWFRTPRQPPKNVKEYLAQCGNKVNDEDMKTRTELMSADAYYNNSSPWESNTFFGVNNSNVLKNDNLIRELAVKVFTHFCPTISERQIEVFASEIQDASNKYTQQQAARCGNLFVICVPKEKSPDILYRAHPYGPPCDCHGTHEAEAKGKADAQGLVDRRILTQLQQHTDTVALPQELQCKTMSNAPPPQYRLYTPMLTPEQGVKSFMLTPVPKQERQAFKASISNIVSFAHSLR
ncbi:MAG: hypothetical protein H0X51_01480 [Parachlamydiaceae bacterium]|nr:hypothetical protein [Parachlamydiaceae bacterium]